ncbi:MAG: hypothetical protein FWE76_04995 [Symbiobacteriaceae bacterium]|nr:hypothetical protein [Symbiobacteriaceae bacterium]
MTRMKSFITQFGCVLLITALLLSNLGSTAASSDYTQSFVSSYPSYNRTIEVGSTISTPTYANAFNWLNSNTATLQLSAAQGAASGTVKGLQPGVATVAVGSRGGQISELNFSVVDSSNITSYTLIGGIEGSLANKAASLTIPIVTVPAVAKNRITWQSLNPAVASVTGDVVTAQVVNGATLILGTFNDKWGVEHSIPYLVIVGNGGSSEDSSGGGSGFHYRPLNKPTNIYEKVDADGNPTKPPTFIFNPGGNPGDGQDREAVIDSDGNFWVQETPPGNIWLPITDNGKLDTDKTIWGGADGKPGGSDDQKANHFGSSWWVNKGQNVWQEVLNPQTLGDLVGGGIDRNPATYPVQPIYDNTSNDGKYYVGPLGPNDEGHYFFYGDPTTNPDGMLDSSASSTAGDDVLYYQNADGSMTTTKPAPKDTTDFISPPNGATVTLDGIEWIKVRNDYKEGQEYVLLMLKEVIGPFPYGADNASNLDFLESSIRHELDKWYAALQAPVLKTLAMQAMTGTSPNKSWPSYSPTGVYAHIPRKADVQDLPFDACFLPGVIYWLADPASSPDQDNWTNQATVRYDGTFGIRNNAIFTPGSPNTRPIVWIRVPGSKIVP